ncbi:hypothetical protein [Burkholderia arboris]|uniref:Uncharacterized protein n=1 Tax=Burkholderia arboris TaxID=488730 RepID=A0ABZ3DXE8_9BURK|nr:hypothetical protein [Burkholderia arboris]MCA8489659.1 hypothetical protein [Burkholderia arboris]UTV60366.1 hypothetical protein NLX30_34855 [Burkholderia arboris]
MDATDRAAPMLFARPAAPDRYNAAAEYGEIAAMRQNRAFGRRRANHQQWQYGFKFAEKGTDE